MAAYALSPVPAGAPTLDSGLGSRPVTRSTTLARRASQQSLRAGARRRSPARTKAKDPRADSSDEDDDDGPAPALSAAAEMLLRTAERPERAAANNAWEYHSGSPRRRAEAGGGGGGSRRRDASAAPGSPAPRVVRLDRNSPVVSGLRRSVSSSEVGDGSPLAAQRLVKRTVAGVDFKTPAASRPRSALASSVGYSSERYRSWGGSAGLASGSKAASAEARPAAGHDGALATVARPATRQVADSALHGSIRIKRTERATGFTGSFLKGPARRGIIRRQSDEQSPVLDQNETVPEQPEAIGVGSRQENVSPAHRDAASSHVRLVAPRSEVEVKELPSLKQDELRPLSHVEVAADPVDRSAARATESAPAVPASAQRRESSKGYPIIFKVPPPLPSQLDQENDPPPTFRRNKPDSILLGAPKMSVQSVEKARSKGSPARKALAPRSHNTPLRPAPPPPKMTVLETATATAGAASVAQTKKKKNYISVNNKLFTRMECVGRGGSGRVYRVMAENFKLFALKRVSLEDVDELAIRGFKGEIDLLRKLDKVDRVVRLYDFEINDEKKTLSVLMEFGELDLKKILDPHLDLDTGRLDMTFTRQIWKEMLECVRAIHECDVVHSDLKPANFVMMQGRLKLIDFGIANAIQDDTVNVHREHQIGTPNYMAPEALLDTNSLAGAARVAGTAKLMKLGRPSDVWSLGCILYQMVYGKPPFGHIPNSMSKVMAITNRSHVIVYPELGVGKVPVPPGLLRTMRRCLSRDPAQRPTVDQLLDQRDPFLYPDAPGSVPVTQEIVRRLQENVLKIIEAKGMPTADQSRPRDAVVREWLDEWSPQLFASIKASMEKGTA